MTTKEINGRLCLIDDVAISSATKAREEMNEGFAELNKILKKCSIKPTEENLRGLYLEGADFIRDYVANTIRKELKGTHVAEKSIQRLIDEAIEELPAESLNFAGLWREGYEPKDKPTPEEIVFTDGVLSLTESYVTRLTNRYTYEVKDSEIEDAETLCNVVKSVRTLIDSGYKLLSNFFPYKDPASGKVTIITTPGLLERTANEMNNQGGIDKGYVLLEMLRSKNVIGIDNHLK